MSITNAFTAKMTALRRRQLLAIPSALVLAALSGSLAPVAPAQDCGGDWERCDIVPAMESRISITNAGYWKVITANGIPDHTIGVFPLLDPDCGRPFAVQEQDYTFVIPAFSSKGELWPGTIFWIPAPPFEDKPETTFGVAVNGVPFDPFAAEWWDVINGKVVSTPTPWNLNILRNDEMQYDLDCSHGHVQPDGAYHYHGFPDGLHDKIKSEQENATLPDGSEDPKTRDRSEIVLLGWAFDGNPIYGEECGIDNAGLVSVKSSHRFRDSTTVPPARTSAADPKVSDFPLGDFSEDYWYDQTLFLSDTTVRLDECNGHVGKTPEFTHGVYHYHVLRVGETLSDIGFPYIGRCYRLFTYGQGPNVFPKGR